jgi:hypothetical protein
MRIFLKIFLGSIFAVISVGLLLAAFFVWRTISWINGHPQAISEAANKAVLITLEMGAPHQKEQMLWMLTMLGTDAQPFVPAIIAAGNQGDQKILEAARQALMTIDPMAVLALDNR